VTAGELHVVFGAGQVGRELARTLAARGLQVRTVTRTRPELLPAGVEWRGADAADPLSAAAAASGAAVVYQCLNAPYTQWPQLFPPLQRAVLAAAQDVGALLVSLENVYGYGPTGGRPMTEDLPLVATTSKGRARAAMTAELVASSEAGRAQIAIGRASDFFGAGVTQSALGEQVFGKALAGKRADFLGDPDLLHTYSYVPDIAAGLATLGTDSRAVGQVWHLPGPATVTTREVLAMVSTQLGRSVSPRTVPPFVLRVLGLVNPMMREMVEMQYEFTAPFVLDTGKFVGTFGANSTPWETAVTDTLDWYRARKGSRERAATP